MLEAVGAEGFAQTSVRSVLDRTGLYRQAFYDNFADKLDCYLSAYDEGVAQVEGLMREATTGLDDWRSALRASMAALLGFLDAEPDVGRALLVEVHAAGPEALARRDAVVRRGSEYLDLARRTADGAAAPGIAPEAVAAGIHSVLHTRLAARHDGRFSTLLPGLMYVAVLPYFGAEVAGTELRMDS